MPRRPRSYQPGVVYHLRSRFVAGEWFIRSDEERRVYLHLFGCALARSDWRCLAFAIMSNHVHLAMLAGATRLASWIGDVHGPFAEWINRRHARIGAVFVRGPNARAVREDGLATLIGYIHRNPVRARVVAHADESVWTSHRAYLDPQTAPAWLNVELGLQRMRFADGAEMHRWIEATPLGRAELDAVRLDPAGKPGRPRKVRAEKAEPA